MTFAECVQGLIAGDFTRLAPLFESEPDGRECQIIRWYEADLFRHEPKALAEAFSCACFNGFVFVVTYFLNHGLDPNGGANTGMNAFHWATDRGQLEVVKILIEHHAALETRNMYGGTVLSGTVWSALNARRPQHLEIIEALLRAGARVDAVDFPSGDAEVDDLLRRFFLD